MNAKANNLQSEEKVTGIGIKYIEKELELFLGQLAFNTQRAYRTDINQFFSFSYKKERQHVTVQDMEQTKSSDIVEYQAFLKEQDLSNTSINRKMKSISSFFSYMEADHPKVRSAIFNNVKSLTSDRKAYGVMSYEEAVQAIELAKESELGNPLSLLFELGFQTAIRLEALLTATWDCFTIGKDGVDVIEVWDKGSKHRKPIPKDLYNRLREEFGVREGKLFVYTKKSGRTYPISQHKVGEELKAIVKKMGIDPKRNIKFHSFKKTSINYVLDSTGDIRMAQAQGNHKSPNTMLQYYADSVEDLTKMPSYTMGKEIDISPLEDLSKEELIALIQGSSAGVKLELLKRLK